MGGQGWGLGGSGGRGGVRGRHRLGLMEGLGSRPGVGLRGGNTSVKAALLLSDEAERAARAQAR